MQKGNIGISTENIFPIIKRFLYSENEIFLRELISNAVDATQKIKTLASINEFKGELGDLTIRVSVDKKKKTITVSDRGVGMNEEEINKYINEIAFSSAEEFLQKYKNAENAIIGHFGLGFYSTFMVSKKVEIISKSYHDEKAIKWICEGSPEYEMEEAEKDSRGTDIILHIDKDSEELLEEHRTKEILDKHCKFLPVEIAYGKQKEWKDGKEIETGKDNIINNTAPAWTKKPTDLKDEDYKNFYRELYPAVFEDPLFHIHLNVDYPFRLTGILYFPKIKSNIEIQKNKIQLYCNQVFVTDSVENIVPEFLTLLHGVIDSPDIPLNVSRSYLQTDSNVRKISSHITKKVADRLHEIFKENRQEFENKWDDLKLFIQYGMISEEKFYDSLKKFVLLKNTDDKYFTIEEYKELVKTNQTDKDKNIVFLYASDKEKQFSYISAAKEKGYDVLMLDGQLDTHFINHLEQKNDKIRFQRVDADTIENLIPREDKKKTSVSEEQQAELRTMINVHLPADKNFLIAFEDLSEKDNPMIITQSEFMRRMKDMSAMGGGAMGFYGDLPDSFNLVVNTNHKLINKIIEQKEATVKADLDKVKEKINPVENDKESLNKIMEGKKEEEISTEEKDKKEELDKKIKELTEEKNKVLQDYAKDHKIIKQVIDLALLANNMLTGEELNKFVKRSVKLID